MSLKIPDNAEIILLGDFNVDYKQRSTVRPRMQILARAHSLEQIIASPTRITENTQSMIDLIFVNNQPRVVSSGIYPLSISDHSLIYCSIKAGVQKSGGCHRDINYRCYKHYDKSTFVDDLEKSDWTFVDSLDDINEIVNKWCDTFSESANKHAPIKTKRVKTTVKAPWMTSELLELMRERDFHLKHAQKSNSDYHWNTYRELRNFINQQVKICKSNYYQNLITSNKDNPGELWKTINEITSRNPTKTTPSCIISENIPVNEPRSIATIMNDYFTSIGSNLRIKLKINSNQSYVRLPLPFPIHSSSKKSTN